MRHSKLALFGIAVIAATSTSTTQAVAAPAPQVIDLNRASLEELLAFDGIGRLYAAKIVVFSTSSGSSMS